MCFDNNYKRETESCSVRTWSCECMSAPAANSLSTIDSYPAPAALIREIDLNYKNATHNTTLLMYIYKLFLIKKKNDYNNYMKMIHVCI